MLKSIVLVALVATAQCIENGKNFRMPPAITNSLVNLGKVDIAIHINTNKGQEPTMKWPIYPSVNTLYTHDPVFEEPCPCSSLRGLKEPSFNNPSQMLNKILMSNDLFSFNKEPVSSSLCCDSHEHIAEETIIFDLSKPKTFGSTRDHMSKSYGSTADHMPFLPFLFPMMDKMLDTKLKPKSGSKPKAEIIFIPQTRDFYNYKKKTPLTTLKKDEIKVVGDNFPLIGERQTVKKDLNDKSSKAPEIKMDDSTRTSTTAKPGEFGGSSDAAEYKNGNNGI